MQHEVEKRSKNVSDNNGNKIKELEERIEKFNKTEASLKRKTSATSNENKKLKSDLAEAKDQIMTLEAKLEKRRSPLKAVEKIVTDGMSSLLEKIQSEVCHDDAQEGKCVACYTKKSNVVFTSCFHLCVCDTCVNANVEHYSRCPICRVQGDFRQVYMA